MPKPKAKVKQPVTTTTKGKGRALPKSNVNEQPSKRSKLSDDEKPAAVASATEDSPMKAEPLQLLATSEGLKSESKPDATFEERLSVAYQWGFDSLRNQVVSKLNVGARFGIVKQVQVVFAVGRGDGALVTHVG